MLYGRYLPSYKIIFGVLRFAENTANGIKRNAAVITAITEMLKIRYVLSIVFLL